jgi:peroxiredoxin
MIEINQTLPSHTFNLLTNEGMTTPTTAELFANKKVVLFAVPGAFTPTCSASHLPGFVVHFDALKEKGVDSVICLSVNDAFVMKSWGDSANAENITMLADGDGAFTKALGLGMETGVFGGYRSQRYAMLVENQTVTQLWLEEPKAFIVSSAESVLANI